MEDKTLDDLFQAYNSKKNDSWLMNVMKLNMDCIIAVQTQKVKTTLVSLARFKAFVAVLGIIWVMFLGFLILHSLTLSKIFFVVSAGFILLANIIAVAVYIKHILLIRQINNSQSITSTQRKLAELQASTLQIVRILFLQMPFYTTWFLTMDILKNASAGMLLFQLTMTAFFTFLAIWLYRNISIKNANKKWFKILFSGKEWTSVIKATAFIQEIDDFKNDR